MAVRRHRALAIALLVALAAQTAWASPATATAVVRALTCCARQGHPVSPAASGRCCGVVRQAEAPALKSAPATDAAPVSVAVLNVPMLPSCSALPPAASHRAIDRFGAGPPLFVQLRALRL
jgi:hypothetical protein